MSQKQSNEDEYADVTPIDWCLYEFATIEYDFQIHPTASRRIIELFERLRCLEKENH